MTGAALILGLILITTAEPVPVALGLAVLACIAWSEVKARE